MIIFKELFINVISPGRACESQQTKSLCNMVPECSGENPWMFYKLANEHLSHTAVNIVWSHFFSPVVVVVVHGVAVMSSSGCQKGSACSCGGFPQSLSHSLFPWQSFRQHHRQAVCKDPYNLFFQQPLLWCSAPERASNYQVQRERTLHPFSLLQFCAVLQGDA